MSNIHSGFNSPLYAIIAQALSAERASTRGEHNLVPDKDEISLFDSLHSGSYTRRNIHNSPEQKESVLASLLQGRNALWLELLGVPVPLGEHYNGHEEETQSTENLAETSIPFLDTLLELLGAARVGAATNTDNTAKSRRTSYPSFNRCPNGGSANIEDFQHTPEPTPGFTRHGGPTDDVLSAHTRKLLAILNNTDKTQMHVHELAGDVKVLQNSVNVLTTAVNELSQLLVDKITPNPLGHSIEYREGSTLAPIHDPIMDGELASALTDSEHVTSPWAHDGEKIMVRHAQPGPVTFCGNGRVSAKSEIVGFRKRTPNTKLSDKMLSLMRGLAQLSYHSNNVAMHIIPDDVDLFSTPGVHIYDENTRILIMNALDSTVVVIYEPVTYCITNAFLLDQHQETKAWSFCQLGITNDILESLADVFKSTSE